MYVTARTTYAMRALVAMAAAGPATISAPAGRGRAARGRLPAHVRALADMARDVEGPAGTITVKPD